MMQVWGAKYVDEFLLEVLFSNGEKKLLDFAGFKSSTSVTDNISFFRSFRVERGYLCWGDDEDVQLSAETLYKWGEEFPVERVLEIPIGDWCYGDTWYEYFTKTHNQKEGHGCPFHQHNYCAFMKVYDSYLLADSTKICPYRDVEKVLKKLYETPIQ